MIVDKFCNIRKYESLIDNLDCGLKAIENVDKLEIGRYEFDKGYFLIQEGNTIPLDEGLFETHKKYIDVQIIVDGQEEIAWLPLDELRQENIYDEVSDKQKFKGDHLHHMTITKDMFWVAFPWDGHQAISHVDNKHHYKKIVLKLLIEE